MEVRFRKYEVQVVALSANTDIHDSDPSEVVLVSTYPEDLSRASRVSNKNGSRGGSLGGSSLDDGGSKPGSPQNIAAQNVSLGIIGIELTVISITDSSITIEVNLLEKGETNLIF